MDTRRVKEIVDTCGRLRDAVAAAAVVLTLEHFGHPRAAIGFAAVRVDLGNGQ